MLNWLVFTSFIFSLAMTLLGLLMDITYQVQYAPQVISLQKDQHDSLENYLQQSVFYRNHPIFNPKLEGNKNFSDLYTQTAAASEHKKIISHKYKTQILSLGHHWLSQKHKIHINDEILNLFSNVKDYSRWTVKEPFESEITTDLIVSGQVFLAHTFHNNPTAIREALMQTRHLSLILLTAENLNLKRAGLSLLEKETDYMDFLNSRLLKTRLLWTPIDKTELKKFRKFLSSTFGLLNYLTHHELLKTVFLKNSLPIGFCSLFKTKERQISWTKSFLISQFPFEPNFKKQIHTIEKIKARASQECLPWNKLVTNQLNVVSYIPYYRRIYGVNLILHASKMDELL